MKHAASQPSAGTATAEACPICGGSAARRKHVVRAAEVAICADCGSWYRVPRPDRAELARLYNKEYYDAWGLHVDETAARVTKRATLAAVLRTVETHQRREPGRAPRLLDVGAATGALLELAAERGWEPYGLELNPYAAELLRQRFGADRVFEGELTACPFADGLFDAVTMTDLIEHVVDVPGTLRAAHRLLRPGGTLCITTPRVDSWSRRLMGAQWLHFKQEHVQYFSRAAVIGALGRAGFVDVAARIHSKRLTLDYLHAQLATYPHWLLTGVLAGLRTVAPRPLRSRPLGLCCGEMLVTARRGPAPVGHPARPAGGAAPASETGAA